MLRNFRTVGPTFSKIASKVAQEVKKNSHEVSAIFFSRCEIITKNVEGPSFNTQMLNLNPLSSVIYFKTKYCNSINHLNEYTPIEINIFEDKPPCDG